MIPKTALTAAFLTLCLGATSLAAETFSVKLGKTVLGTLSYSQSRQGATLTSTLGNTPLGVFNGTFQATSTKTGGLRTFDGLSKSSRKTRHVQVSVKAGKAVETLVDPASEMTPLSNPSKVPAGIIDPVQAIGALIDAGGCPALITIYDGRRAIALRPGAKSLDGDTQTCAVAYRVIAGPGHLSPLKISKAKMKLTYVGADKARKLTRIDLGSGMFNLVLERTD